MRLFLFLPRWWACDLVRLPVRLDERWGTGYWTDESWWPGPLCEACRRRTAWVYVGGLDDDEEPYGQYLDTRRIDLCLWCDIGPTEVLKSGARRSGRSQTGKDQFGQFAVEPANAPRTVTSGLSYGSGARRGRMSPVGHDRVGVRRHGYDRTRFRSGRWGQFTRVHAVINGTDLIKLWSKAGQEPYVGAVLSNSIGPGLAWWAGAVIGKSL